jgi:hypothetical protein
VRFEHGSIYSNFRQGNLAKKIKNKNPNLLKVFRMDSHKPIAGSIVSSTGKETLG